MIVGNEATDEYVQKSYELCKKRIVLAGYRMANIILDIFKAKNPALNENAKEKEEIVLSAKV